MKKKKDYTLLALAIPFIIAVLANLPGCYSDNKPSLKETDYIKERLMDYQIYLKMDTLRLYDGERLVGEHIDSNYNHGAFIDSTILNDNQ